MPVLECRQLGRHFGSSSQNRVTVLEDVTMQFHSARTDVLMGPSGSGKTTLLSVLGCLLSPSSGELWLDGERVPFQRPHELVRLRREKIGFVFQQPHLLPFQTARQQLELVAANAGLNAAQRRDRIAELLTRLQLLDHADCRPEQLSGGQQQRVSIARALLHRPRIVLADEPTAALDWERGCAAVQLLIEQARQADAMLLTVTHDLRLVPLFDQPLHLEQGRLQEVPR